MWTELASWWRCQLMRSHGGGWRYRQLWMQRSFFEIAIRHRWFHLPLRQGLNVWPSTIILIQIHRRGGYQTLLGLLILLLLLELLQFQIHKFKRNCSYWFDSYNIFTRETCSSSYIFQIAKQCPKDLIKFLPNFCQYMQCQCYIPTVGTIRVTKWIFEMSSKILFIHFAHKGKGWPLYKKVKWLWTYRDNCSQKEFSHV